MNNVVISGFIAKESDYIKNEAGITEYRFFVSTTNPNVEGASIIPCKTIGQLADKCQIEFGVGGYIELVGELVKPPNKNMFVLAHEIIFQKDKDRQRITIRSTEFMQIYKPTEIMKRLKKTKK